MLKSMHWCNIPNFYVSNYIYDAECLCCNSFLTNKCILKCFSKLKNQYIAKNCCLLHCNTIVFRKLLRLLHCKKLKQVPKEHTLIKKIFYINWTPISQFLLIKSHNKRITQLIWISYDFENKDSLWKQCRNNLQNAYAP